MNYSTRVIDYFEHPRNVAGTPGEAALTGRAGSLRSGALIEFQVEMDGERIGSAAFRAWGCPHTIALASWMTEYVAGRTLAQLLPLELESVAGELGLPAEKWHCVLTAEDALRAVQEKLKH